MRLSAAPLLITLLLAACGNPESSANQIYVDASQAASQASGERDPLRRYALLKKAADAVHRITAEYPSTGAALRVAANENIGPYARDALRHALADASAAPAVCSTHLNRQCFTDGIAASINYIATSAFSDTPEAHSTFKNAISGYPYAALWTPEVPSAAFASKPDDLTALRFRAAADAFPHAVHSIYIAKGIDAAALALQTLVAGDNELAQHILSGFSYGLAAPFTKQRGPSTYRDLLRLASVLQAPLPATFPTELAARACSIPKNPQGAAWVAADCPPDEIITTNGSGYVQLPEETVQRLYDAATPENKTKLATSYVQETYKSPDRQLRWLNRAGKAADIDTLTSMYTSAIIDKRAPDPRITAALAKAPEPAPADPLTKVGVTTRNIVLLHAQNALAAQMPAVLQNLRAIPGYSYKVDTILSTLVTLYARTPSLDAGPLIDAIADITATWGPQQSSTREGQLKRATWLLITPKGTDPLPFLQRLYGGQPTLSHLSYEILLLLKENGHANLYDQAMALPFSEFSAWDSVQARALRHRVSKLRENSDQAGLLALLASLPQKDRYDAIGIAFYADNSAKRNAMYEATLAKYPVDFFVKQHVITEGFALTPQEQAQIYIDHAPEIAKRSPTPLDSGWITNLIAKLDKPTRLALLAAVARQHPEAWLHGAGAALIMDDK